MCSVRGRRESSVGTNSTNGISFLKEEYKDSMTLQDGLVLAIKTMCKTLDATHPKAEDCTPSQANFVVEFVTVTKNEKDEVKISQISQKDLKDLIDKAGVIVNAPEKP